jgi:hypothetical protein
MGSSSVVHHPSARPGGPCRASIGVASGMSTLRLENDVLSLTVLIEKGADIFELRHERSGVDVLLKTEWGLRDPRHASPSGVPLTQWLSRYPGGWQELLPNGGPPCIHQGIEHSFHGEAAVVPWSCEILCEDGERAEAVLSVRLLLTPLRLERRMRIESGSGVVVLRERLTNEGTTSIDYMWGHHPALGAPFLAPSCRIDLGARTLEADASYMSPFNPLVPGRKYEWPHVSGPLGEIDLCHMAEAGVRRTLVGYLSDWDGAWYAVTNTELGVGFGLVWSAEDFPSAWLWQELRATDGFPWFGTGYALAIEPNTSYPALGIAEVCRQTGTQRSLGPGESVEVELRAVLYEAWGGVRSISSAGTVEHGEVNS